jgi:oligoribonuclease NrnB/cAMP/cGMP phosphodiesterase (DHH superfamily)
MKIIYHGDLDGHCSGAIAYKYYRERGVEPELIEAIRYGLTFDNVEKDEPVIVVDFSLPFTELLKITKNIIWIDHHQTAIDEFEHLGLEGIRKSGIAGCELTWKFFYPTLEVPKVVKHIGDMDVWKWEYKATEAVIEGLQLLDTHPSNTWDWNLMLTRDYNIEPLYLNGLTCVKYRENYYAKMAKNLAYEVDWLGYKCIVCNCAFTGSLVFNSIKDKSKYDLMVVYYHEGDLYNASLYSEKDYVNCGEIAKTLGGGGHVGAAGFRCNELPFKRVRSS